MIWNGLPIKFYMIMWKNKHESFLSSFENVNFWKNDALILPIIGHKTLSTVPVLYYINLNGFFHLICQGN